MNEPANVSTPASTSAQAPAPAPSGKGTPGTPHTEQRRRLWIRIINFVVLVLSVLLIVYISIDTFRHINFLANHRYMTFQFWVCLVFMASFFIELSLVKDRWAFFRREWLFLLLSIPYLNIINLLSINPSQESLYFLRFIPLARGGLAIAIIVSYFTRNRIASVFITYTVILLLVVYFCSLIVFYREQPVNPQIPDFAEALWFSSMVVTTIGCDIAPVTVAGKIIQCVLAGMGMVMFPLFTVYITSTVQRLRARQRASTPAAPPAPSSAPSSAPPSTAPDSSVSPKESK